jgi:hypothetical protein
MFNFFQCASYLALPKKQGIFFEDSKMILLTILIILMIYAVIFFHLDEKRFKAHQRWRLRDKLFYAMNQNTHDALF